MKLLLLVSTLQLSSWQRLLPHRVGVGDVGIKRTFPQPVPKLRVSPGHPMFTQSLEAFHHWRKEKKRSWNFQIIWNKGYNHFLTGALKILLLKAWSSDREHHHHHLELVRKAESQVSIPDLLDQNPFNKIPGWLLLIFRISNINWRINSFIEQNSSGKRIQPFVPVPQRLGSVATEPPGTSERVLPRAIWWLAGKTTWPAPGLSCYWIGSRGLWRAGLGRARVRTERRARGREGTRARVRVRERRGFLRSRRREPERFSWGKRGRRAALWPYRGWCGLAGWAGQGWAGWRGKSGVLPESSASGRMQTRTQPPRWVPRFPFSYPLNAPVYPHHGDESSRGELPTWQPRLCLCFPLGGMLVSAPSPGEGWVWCGGAISGLRTWFGARERMALMQWDLSHVRRKGKKMCHSSQAAGLELIRRRATPNS